MEFKSARFAGNAVLEEILNDADTGTKKLQKGSPADAVTIVQQALIDLQWVGDFHTATGTILIPLQFVDGDYGPWTYESVLKYKTYYDIQFPGVDGFDGFAGPRTLKALDQHCVLLEEASAAINQHVAELVITGSVGPLELQPPDGLGRVVHPIRRSAGAFSSVLIGGEVGAVIFKRTIGAFALHGPLYVRWVELEQALGTGEATGAVGFPVGDILKNEDRAIVNVERGALTLDARTGLIVEAIDPDTAAAQHDIEF